MPNKKIERDHDLKNVVALLDAIWRATRSIAASQLTQSSAFPYGHTTGAGLIFVKHET